jgi:acyl-CoA reductase-like NAD-dependent aldehyde dehydrogenase
MEVFYNAGQVCNLPARLIIHQDVYEPFMQKFTDRANHIKVGPTFDQDADMGPVVSSGQLESVMEYIEAGKQQGGRLVLGGERLSSAIYDKGYYVAPTIFDEVSSGMKIVAEEIFGPVATAFRYKDLEEAIEIANDTTFGLAAGIWTNNLDAAQACARRLNAGTVWINVWNKSFPEIPVGGNKASGFGRELGIEGMYEFTTVKGVHMFQGA